MFEREVSKEIAAVYHSHLLGNPSIERIRRTNIPYDSKFLRSLSLQPDNIFGEHCGGCQPLTQSDWIGGESRNGHWYIPAYADERLSNYNFAHFSRCGNKKYPNCRQDGRIDIRLLKIIELWDYVNDRPTELIKKDRDNLIKIDTQNEESYQFLFNVRLIPISEEVQKSNKEQEKVQELLLKA